MITFDKAMALSDRSRREGRYPVRRHEPSRLSSARGHEKETRPVILVGGGWESTVVENYLAIGVAALQRGYHVLLHDGPGQGRLLSTRDYRCATTGRT